jgi:4-methyl-5(b-hydroxyethyl)-thiazole monophosphate biosynthesis
VPKTALVILAEGFEEIEAIAPIDVLRRAGVRVTIAGVMNLQVKSSRNIGVQADVLLKDVTELPDAVILPGGLPGATNLAKSKEVAELVKKMNLAGKLVAAICAAPAAVLVPLGILPRRFICKSVWSRTEISSRVKAPAHLLNLHSR